MDTERAVTSRMRRWLAVASAAATLFAGSALTVPAAANGCPSLPFGGGAGTSSDPYRIRTATDLRNVAASATCWGYSYALIASIDVSGSPWTPIGTSSNPFTGSLDGGGFTVSGMSISGSAAQQGLFGVLRGTSSDNAVVRDLRVVSATITGTSQVGVLAGLAEFTRLQGVSASGSVSGTTQVGGLIGQLGGTARGSTLTNATSSVAVTATGTDAGGLVGMIDSGSSVSSSSASGAVNGTTVVGGLVGIAAGGISTSSASGNVTGSLGSVGGLVGRSTSTITASSASGAVSAGGTGAGGLVGASIGSITESSASGSVTAAGQSSVGGLVGSFNSSGDVVRSFATGSVSGGSDVGGLIGLLTQSSVADSYATGTVTGTSNIGGLVGFADISSLGGVVRSYATGAVTATGSPVGGLVADGRAASVTSSYWATDLSGQASSPGGGAGRTSTQLRDIATFAGWSITAEVSGSSTWGICAGANDGTPFLQWSAMAGACSQVGGPPPWLQAYGRLAANDPCEPGWLPSWERWMHAGNGGFTCVRTVPSLG